MQFFEAFPLESEDGFEPFTFPLLKSCPPHNLQAFIEKSCYKKSKNLYGSKLGKTTLFFIDDLNLSATKDNIHSGLTLELLRQILEYSGFYDPHKFFWKSLENISFIASLSQNSQSFHKGLSRLCRNFNCIYMGSPKQEFLQRLFEGYLNEYFLTGGDFAKEVKELCNGIISGTLEVFRRVKEFLKPIPRKFYYNFSMKDIKAVFQGLLLAKNNTLIMSSREEFIHLWIHEVYRVFYDGLNEESDRIWLKENVKMITSHILQYSGSNNEPDGFFFSEILRLDQQNSIYEEMKDFNKIKKVLEEKLINDPFWKIDSFIMSPEVIRYILRLLRILKASSSQRNILNLGLIGSGKKTLCKIAAFLKNMLVWEFNTTSPETFQEDLKHYLIKAALTQKPFILIFTDNAFDFEEIVYKIAILMNPLTPISELFENYEEILTEAAKSSKDKEISLCLEFKKRSHVMLCVSSESPALQKALREYELSRFCSGTIYYSPWGTEALLHVAQGLIPFESSGLKNLTVEIYQIVENEALNQTNYKPKVYLSPKSYVEMVMLFKELLEKNERIIKKKIKTLNNGLNKLASSQTLVSTLNKNLLALEPQLLLQSEKTEEIYKKLALEHAQANEKEMLIIQETAAMNIEMDRFQNLSLEAQNELEKAYPLLKEAQTALSALNKSDISEIRTFNNPPPIVAMVLEAVCLLLEEKTDWGSIKAVMTDIDFLGRLMALDTEKMKDSTIKKLKVLINKPEFEPESIGHKSLACKSLAMWCRAIENYYRIERIVRPKRIKTQELNKLLSDKKHLLDSKASELSLARSKLSELQFECDSNLSLRQEVMKEIELTSIRLSNSEKLNLLLYSEENKWQSLLQKLELDLSTIVGDTLLLSACLSFFGPFKPIIREKLLENWEDRFVFHDIKTKSDFLMSKMMFSDTQIRNWILLGLPNDERAIENGVLILGNRKPCVIIDPEGVGLSWLKASGMKILTMNAINKLFLAKILALGEGLIIDNFSEPLEEITQIILERKLMLIDGVKKIMLPEGLVNFNENFTLFLTTKQQDFELSSALFLKTNVVSFQVTYEGLVDQLLADVIWLEKPDLEASYKQINETMNRDKEDLAVREEKILILLDRPSELNILDDHELLSTLEISKKQTEEIERSLAESLQVEKKVLATRRLYKDIASLGASLYFTIKGLVHLEPIYYYSLESFKRSYKLAFKLKVFKNESDLERRSKALTKEIIRILYEKVSLGVFHEHKQILGFIMLMDLNRRKGLIPETLWELFLKGKIISSQMKIEGVNSFNNDNNNKRPSFVREDYWAEMLKFAKILKIEAYLLFMRSFTEKANEWKKFLDYPHEVSSIIPIPALELSDFVQLSSSFSLKNSTKNDILQILIKSFFLKNFKPNALPSFITIWLTPHLLLPSQTPDLDKVLCNIDRFTPLLLLLAPGTDPTDHLLRLSKEKHKGLNFASLNPVAFKKSLEKARDNGSWLIVQNCHLFSNFLKIIESEEKEVHQDFRLIMTTDPKTNFPIELLAKSFKFAFEKQQNFKSAMIVLFILDFLV